MLYSPVSKRAIPKRAIPKHLNQAPCRHGGGEPDQGRAVELRPGAHGPADASHGENRPSSLSLILSRLLFPILLRAHACAVAHAHAPTSTRTHARQDGLEATRYIRKEMRLQGLPVVAFSAEVRPRSCVRI
jgi:CheY-like chemotaxis protein